MRIEGLKERRLSDTEATYAPDGRRGMRRISLSRMPGGAAVAQVLEGRERPGLDPGESVAMVSYIEPVAERVVRALAKMHLGADEVADAYTAADEEMIVRGFTIGLAGSTEGGERRPVWMAHYGTHYLVVSREVEGGLPALTSDPACLVFGVPDGRRVIVHTEDLATVFRFIESGKLPSLLSAQGDTEVRNAYLKGVVTFH